MKGEVYNLRGLQFNKITWFKILVIYLLFVGVNSGLLVFSSLSISDVFSLDIYQNFEREKILNILIICLISIIAPTVTIGIRFIFLVLLAYLFNLSDIVGKKSSLWVATLSYVPSLIGSLVNYILNVILGDRGFGYTSLLSYVQTDNDILNYLYTRMNPFEISGVVLLGILFSKISGGKIKDSFLIIAIWYIADFMLNLLL